MKFGCDEAGRGPVLGSMFVGCVYGYEIDIMNDVKDSKELDNSKIHSLAARIQSADRLRCSVIEVTPSDIDSEHSLTDLSAEAFADSIIDISPNLRDKGIIDAYTSNHDRAVELVQDKLDALELDIIVENEADVNYSHASAASILAKSARENHIKELSDTFGDIGSGYPSDPNTREFLEQYVEENRELPSCARQSWSTCDDILEAVLD